VGILYRQERPSFEEVHPGVGDPPLHARQTPEEAIRALIQERVLTLP